MKISCCNRFFCKPSPEDPISSLTSRSLFEEIKEGKIIATEIEGPYGEAKNGKILNFAKIYLGYSTEEEIDEKWTGGTTLSSFGENVVYGRVEFIDGNYETLTISKPEFKQFLFGPNVQEIMM